MISEKPSGRKIALVVTLVGLLVGPLFNLIGAPAANAQQVGAGTSQSKSYGIPLVSAQTSDVGALAAPTPGTTQPYVAVYHDTPPKHFGIEKAKATCNFGGTDRTKIQADNYLSCALSTVSFTGTAGYDYAFQASVTLKQTGNMIIAADVWTACENTPFAGCANKGTTNHIATFNQTISAVLTDDITLYMDWGSSGNTVTWSYSKNTGSPISYYTYTKPTSDGHTSFVSGICYISEPNCAPIFIIRTARYLEAGIGSAYNIGQSGWFVTIKNPSFAEKRTDTYISYFAPGSSIHGNDAFFDNDFKWGGAIYSGVNADYHEKLSSVSPGQVKFYYTGTTIANNVRLWNGNPITIANTTTANSPTTTDSYEGEKRFVNIDDTTTKDEMPSQPQFLFYYDSSNIKYVMSTDAGLTWSSPLSLATGTLVSDSYRWSIVYTPTSGTQYIYVFYWIQGNPDTQNHHFKVVRGTVTGGSVSWSSPIEVGFTTANTTDCGAGGACAAVVTGRDSNGNLFAAFRWKSGGASTYSYQIKESTNGGLDWFDSLTQQDSGSSNRISMALTKLGSGKMLLAYGEKENQYLWYRIYTPGSGWTAAATWDCACWTSNVDKQISADSDSSGNAYVTIASGGTSGTVYVFKFTSTGATNGSAALPAGGLTHSLPSITVTPDDVIHVFTIAGSTPAVYETKNVGGTWQSPTTPFGTSFTSLNQLTSLPWYYGAVWKEGNNIRYSYAY